MKICWSMPNGVTGRGQEAIPFYLAEIWLRRLEAEHPEMKHWTEPE